MWLSEVSFETIFECEMKLFSSPFFYYTESSSWHRNSAAVSYQGALDSWIPFGFLLFFLFIFHRWQARNLSLLCCCYSLLVSVQERRLTAEHIKCKCGPRWPLYWEIISARSPVKSTDMCTVVTAARVRAAPTGWRCEGGGAELLPVVKGTAHVCRKSYS